MKKDELLLQEAIEYLESLAARLKAKNEHEETVIEIQELVGNLKILQKEGRFKKSLQDSGNKERLMKLYIIFKIILDIFKNFPDGSN